MSRSLLDPLPLDVLAPQRQASDPAGSAWVRANAGSGKTHVLTERVMRLLLAGVRPEEILCLTYTKAAAAEMRRRVAGRLAEWALLPEPELVARLTAMEDARPDAKRLARARTLFAHALDTPGGLRINTIHAFSEAVLHRFPLEAGVPFDFAVIEEVEAAALIHAAREAAIAEGLRGGSDLAGPVETLFRLISDYSMTDAIDAALAESRKLRRVLADRAGAKARLRELCGCPEGESRAAILRRVEQESLFPSALCEALFAHLPPEPTRQKNLRFVDKLWRRRTEIEDGEVRFEVFLKDDGGAYDDRRLRGIVDPVLCDAVGNEHDRLADLYPLYRRASLVERSEALLDLLAEIVDRYERHKAARSQLDFDDLIERLGALLSRREQADWVRYKLDAGITHILVDESQDTNPEQWAIVTALQSEFFAGAGAVSRPRTLFAVGDEKQSIFSFQGAEPKLFGALGDRFAREARGAELPFARVPLHTSFRTLPNILDAVDRVFADPARRAAVLAADEQVRHRTARAEQGGTVTFWPLARPPEEKLDVDNWPTDPVLRVQSAPRQLAERIAGEIRGWLDRGRALGPRGRPVAAEDILILVQTRSALFQELIRALSLKGIPTPGADRLPVTTHIAVLDLLALGDVIANPADNLQLAALLRSPLFEVSEEELYLIGAGRAPRQTLWQALSASTLLAARSAAARLGRWRDRLDFERPFEFYTEVLYGDGGLKRFHARLGGEVDDVLAEFLELALAHEQSAAPSLQAFLAEMRAQDISIKRELAEPGAGVRVMTVHGAKGLEAPIVILADAATRAGANQLPPVYVVTDEPGPLFIHAPNKAVHTPETRKFREAAEAAADAEYWRKLYVGMTRAEDELYIAGYLSKKGNEEDTWYAAIRDTLAPHARTETDADGNVRATVYPAEPPEPQAAPTAAAKAASAFGPLILPPLPQPTVVPVITPSSAHQPAPAERLFATATEAVVDADLARKSGIALHALLQHLGHVPREHWDAVAGKALAVLLPEAPERHAGLARKAVSIVTRPEFATLFGPDSRAEVPFLVDIYRNGEPARLAGRMDRLVVANGRVLVVDYKSDAVPPGAAPEVPASYQTQVGLYALVASQLFPGLAVEAGILWTTLESLMILPPTQLRDAVSAFTLQ